MLGENGSGKSTLVAVLSGLRRHDEGQLLLAGEPVHFRSPKQARAAGIATVWQDLAVAPLLSIWRNFFLGAEPTRGVLAVAPARRRPRPRDDGRRRWRGSGVTGLDPDQPASTLQAGARQSLAIARALHFGARALIVDEPTAPLTVAQQTLLLQAIVAARSQGLAVAAGDQQPALRPPRRRPLPAAGARPGGRQADPGGRRRLRPHPADGRRGGVQRADRGADRPALELENAELGER